MLGPNNINYWWFPIIPSGQSWFSISEEDKNRFPSANTRKKVQFNFFSLYVMDKLFIFCQQYTIFLFGYLYISWPTEYILQKGRFMTKESDWIFEEKWIFAPAFQWKDCPGKKIAVHTKTKLSITGCISTTNLIHWQKLLTFMHCVVGKGEPMWGVVVLETD